MLSHNMIETTIDLFPIEPINICHRIPVAGNQNKQQMMNYNYFFSVKRKNIPD